jgi:Holliday junction resolvase
VERRMSRPHETFYIDLAGERSVVEWLENKGFAIVKWDTRSPGTTEIKAKSGKPFLVRVKTAVQPEEPSSLSSDEEKDIVSQVKRIGGEAWEAKVHLDSNLQPTGKINWRKIFPIETSKT